MKRETLSSLLINNPNLRVVTCVTKTARRDAFAHKNVFIRTREAHVLKKRDVNETNIAVSVSHRLESIQRRERYHHQEIQSRRQEDTQGMFSRGTSFRA